MVVCYPSQFEGISSRPVRSHWITTLTLSEVKLYHDDEVSGCEATDLQQQQQQQGHESHSSWHLVTCPMCLRFCCVLIFIGSREILKESNFILCLAGVSDKITYVMVLFNINALCPLLDCETYVNEPCPVQREDPTHLEAWPLPNHLQHLPYLPPPPPRRRQRTERALGKFSEDCVDERRPSRGCKLNAVFYWS